MIPGAAVVAGPSGGVALRAGVSGARQHKRALIALQLAQAFVSGANIFHSVDVVDGAVIESCAVVEAVPGVERHGFVGAVEKRGLVHVVPKAGDAHADEVFVQGAPPVACSGEREIRKYAFAGPYDSNKDGAV